MDKVRLNFDVDKKIDLTFENDNKIKVLMLKGDDGFDPKVVTARDGDKVTVSITDASGTKTFDITDGYTPTVEARKEDGITTINITNASGTTTTEIHDGADLTGGVPTGAVIGFDGTEADIPNGFEKSSETFGGGGTNIPQQAEAPSNPQKDDLWIDTDDNKFQRYTGEEWQNIGGAGGEVLPVGAEIDFEGTDIPTGWEQVNDPSKPTLLYSDETGTDIDFTLTDDISNYSFIEVFGYNSFTGNKVSSGKIKSSNNSKVQVLLRDNYVQTGRGVSQAFCFKVLKFEGKNVNRIQYNTWWTDSGSVENDNIFVTEVIGFKY